MYSDGIQYVTCDLCHSDGVSKEAIQEIERSIDRATRTHRAHQHQPFVGKQFLMARNLK